MKVKPLDWMQVEEHYWAAKVFEHGNYRVYELGGKWIVSFFGYQVVSPSIKIKDHKHGMALAQAHYERITLSAIVDDGIKGF